MMTCIFLLGTDVFLTRHSYVGNCDQLIYMSFFQFSSAWHRHYVFNRDGDLVSISAIPVIVSCDSEASDV